MARRAMPELERRSADPASPLAGVHFEGPYISREYIGAHPPERVTEVPDHVPEWMRSPALAVVTIAPELPGAAALIAELDRLGVMVSLGHSGATAWETRAAADAGARMVTHIFNAMTPIHHRETRLPGAALTDERLLVSVLSDNVHVAAPALELVRRAAGDRVVLVSDATPGAHAAPGRYVMSDVEIVREEDGSIRTPDGRLAGSALTLDAHVRLWASLTSATLGEAIQGATERPASLIGGSAGFGIPGRPSFWIRQANGHPLSGPTHIAFHATDRARVDRFHEAALAAGGTDNGPPGLRPYHPTYYGA